MSTQSFSRSLPLLVAATAFWGCSSAVLATFGGEFASGASVAALAGAGTLAGFSVLRGRGRLPPLRDRVSLYLQVGTLEAANLGLYVAALGLGPLPVMVALHLTAPIILILWGCLRGTRRWSLTVAIELFLIAGAITLLAGIDFGRDGAGDALVGGGLALMSAVALAVLINRVALAAPREDATVAGAFQLLVAGILIGPLTLLSPPTVSQFTVLVLAGAALLGPGFAFYWRALRSIDAQTAGVVGLNEAIIASLVGVVAFGAALELASVLAAVLVIAAIVLELCSSRTVVESAVRG